jgi:hypothetical protein
MSAEALNTDLASGERSSFATGSVRGILRLEGAAALAGAVALYAHAGFSWPVFALLFLAPDLAMLGYLAGPKTGAVAYNLVHTYAGPPILALAGYLFTTDLALALALTWVAHIGLDRALGYGLKYPTRFGDTHLGRVGR